MAIDMVLVKNGSEDLEKDSFDELIRKFQKCHDIIWEGGKRDPAFAFDEFSKILMIKIYDERYTPASQPYAFQVNDKEDSSTVAARIRTIYDLVKEKNASVFKVDMKLSDESIIELVNVLQKTSIRNTDLDIKGRAFEQFLGKVFRGEYGQYFTPRNIVKFMIEILDPDENDIIIDPACGSGGFLLYSLMHVTDKIEKKYNEDTDTLKKISWDFAHKQLFGIEINDMIARISMMDMVLHEDGHSNIECNNALVKYDEFDKARDIRPGKYSIILTNPPFGATVNDDSILSQHVLGRRRKNQKTEILFIERCINLLKDHGKMGIVLPDSIFTNLTLEYVRKFILEKTKILAIISLPSHAFVPSGAGVKSSLLFLEKTSGGGKDQLMFKAIANHIGFDARRDEDVDELPQILEDWNQYKKGSSEFKIAHLAGAWNFNTKINPEQSNDISLETTRERKTLDFLSDGNIFVGTTPARKAYTIDGYKILKVRDLTGKGIEWDNDERGFVSKEFFMQKQTKILHLNDILFISAAHHPKYIGQKVDIVTHIPSKYSEGVICCAEIIVSRLNPEKINPLYVYLYLKTGRGYEAIQSCIRGQTAHIYPKDIKMIEIPIPSMQESDEINNELVEMKKMLRLKEETDEKLTSSLASLMKAVANDK